MENLRSADSFGFKISLDSKESHRLRRSLSPRTEDAMGILESVSLELRESKNSLGFEKSQRTIGSEESLSS